MISNREDVESRFWVNIKDHDMEIIKDDGVNRHLRFKREKSYVYGFDIITWSGHLTITGDCGTWVFSRVEDMFNFFIMDDYDFNMHPDKELNINPDYWAEKVLSRDIHSGIKEWSPEKFKENVKDVYDNHCEYHYTAEEGDEDYEKEMEEKESLWSQIEDDVLYYADDEHAAVSAVYNWSDWSGDFGFGDFWEYSHKDFTFHYLWNLYAIVWGIQKYRALEKVL
jgi:hypothetical protein